MSDIGYFTFTADTVNYVGADFIGFSVEQLSFGVPSPLGSRDSYVGLEVVEFWNQKDVGPTTSYVFLVTRQAVAEPLIQAVRFVAANGHEYRILLAVQDFAWDTAPGDLFYGEYQWAPAAIPLYFLDGGTYTVYLEGFPQTIPAAIGLQGGPYLLSYDGGVLGTGTIGSLPISSLTGFFASFPPQIDDEAVFSLMIALRLNVKEKTCKSGRVPDASRCPGTKLPTICTKVKP